MKALLQRVSRAEVLVEGRSVGRIGHGLLILLGVETGDRPDDADRLADKAAELRIFEDDGGKMNLSVEQTGGQALVVSQFTLAADTRRGRRPSYARAAAPELAEPLYERFVGRLRRRGLDVRCGVFRTAMQLELVNEGPVTVLLDPPSRRENG